MNKELYKPITKIIGVLFIGCLILFCFCKNHDDNYLEPENISNNAGQSEHPSIAVDSRGTVHLVWDDNTQGNEEIFYAYKYANDTWSIPVNLSNNESSSRYPCIQIDKNDKIHLVWQDASPASDWRIFYTYKAPDSLWSIPETITAQYASLVPVLAVDNNFGLHLFWKEGFSAEDCRYHYAYKPIGGHWTIQYLFTTEISSYEMKVDNNGGVHVVLDPHFETYYLEKSSNGIWSDTVRISHSPTDWQSSNDPSIAIGGDTTIHVTWAEGDTALQGIAYVKKTPHSGWGQIEAPYKNEIGSSRPKICVGTSGKIYVVWIKSNIGYGIKDETGWQKPKTLVKNSYSIGQMTMTMDNTERIYYAWKYSAPAMPENNEIYYIEFNPLSN